MENYIKVEKTGFDGEIFYKLLSGNNSKLYLSKLINVSNEEIEITPEDIQTVQYNEKSEILVKTKESFFFLAFRYLNPPKDEVEKHGFIDYIITMLFFSGKVISDIENGKIDRSFFFIMMTGKIMIEDQYFGSSYLGCCTEESKKFVNIFIQLPYLNICKDSEKREFYEMLGSHTPDQYKGNDEVMDMMIEEIKELNNVADD